jgi:sulfate transport system ATP-binding protein
VSIVVKNVSKRFGNFAALDDVSLEVPNGELVALLGPSGSGKTTLLRIIAGLEVADDGAVLHHDEDVTAYSPRDRKVGFVFQHYALFRHMTIADNIGYGLRVRGVAKPERQARVAELLQLIRLENFGSRYPSQLSGGQRQRVALARALAARPAVLLLDEPFGALDAKVRTELRQWLRRLHEEIHVTSVFVTHDQEEAFEVADRVVVMNHGKIEQVGTPAEVFEHPANAFVLDFLGNVNVFDGELDGDKPVLRPSNAPPASNGKGSARHAEIYVRPHELKIEHHKNGEASIEAKVVHLNPAGLRTKIELRSQGLEKAIFAELTAERCAELGLKTGDTVYVSAQRAHVFAPTNYSI